MYFWPYLAGFKLMCFINQSILRFLPAHLAEVRRRRPGARTRRLWCFGESMWHRISHGIPFFGWISRIAFFQLQSCCLEKREQEQAGLCPCLWCSDMFCIFFGGWSPHILSALPQRTDRTARGDPGVEEPRPVGRWQKPSWWFHSWGLSKKRRGWSSTDLLGFRMFNTCSIYIYIYTYNYIYIYCIYIYTIHLHISYIYIYMDSQYGMDEHTTFIPWPRYI